jgi:arsenite methyltransferase
MVMSGIGFDEEVSRQVEKLYLTPDVAAQRCEVLKLLELRQGERVLDIGSGPGLLAYEMAVAVGPEGRVCAIDTSADMISMSKRRCAELPWVEFELADAVKLPYNDSSFDAAVSTQVYEYVPDISAALKELYRILRSGGRALILDTDYGSLIIHSEDRTRMAHVLAAWDEHFVHGDLPRTLAPSLRDAGFTVRQRSIIPMFNPEYHTNTYSYGLIGIIASFVVGRKGVTKEEVDTWTAELRELGRQGRYFFSLSRYVFFVEKPHVGPGHRAIQ